MKEKKASNYYSVFDDPESVSMPDSQDLPIEPAEELRSWRRSRLSIFERRDSVVNFMAVIIVCFYLLCHTAGFIAEMIKGNIDINSHLQAGFVPILCIVLGYLFEKKQKREK